MTAVFRMLSSTPRSTLFLFVGYTEIKLQLDATVTDSHGNIHRRRASGDGHDNMVSKLVEFALSLPFTVGLKSKTTASCLAGVLILEALTSWLWFLSKVRSERAQLRIPGCPMTHSDATRASQNAASHSPLTGIARATSAVALAGS